ncbi:MAG: NADH:ubiquinone reductase (Na(+)-transporting) subunit C [Myxococcales bacterium]|nr:NADH:ubiquinone reductase (Na(+)-transporting) subunit C [Myxococcales bacterium]
MQDFSNKYVIGFAVAICIACSLLIAGTALSLKDVQDKNAEVDMKLNVLKAAGIVKAGDSLNQDEVLSAFEEKVTAQVVDIVTGDVMADQKVASLSKAALTADIYKLKTDPNLRPIYLVGPEKDRTTIIPIAGKGLWGTVYGFLALAPDFKTVRNITFRAPKETPGLGAECEKPAYRELFVNKLVLDQTGEPAFQVARGSASPMSCTQVPGVEHCVDGMSGATLTGNGISEMITRALGGAESELYVDKYGEAKGGYGAYFAKNRQGGS